METTGREKVLWSIAILMVLLYALIPVIWITSLSLKPPADIGDGKFIPETITLDNYDQIFSTNLFNAALVNSIGIATISTLISIVLASMAAYALARLDFSGKALILSGALAIAMFPAISIIGPLFDMWRSLGLFDTWLGVTSCTSRSRSRSRSTRCRRSSARSRGSSSRLRASTAPRRSRRSGR